MECWNKYEPNQFFTDLSFSQFSQRSNSSILLPLFTEFGNTCWRTRTRITSKEHPALPP